MNEDWKHILMPSQTTEQMSNKLGPRKSEYRIETVTEESFHFQEPICKETGGQRERSRGPEEGAKRPFLLSVFFPPNL